MLQIEIDDDRDAGKIVAFLIRRNHLRTKRKSFQYWMNVASSDSKCTFASGLFDRTGMLKQRLYGNFGPETNLGNILYIRNVTLKEQHSRRNLGCKVLRKFLELATKQPHTADGWWLAGALPKSLPQLLVVNFTHLQTKLYCDKACHKKNHCLQSCTMSHVRTAGVQLGLESSTTPAIWHAVHKRDTNA